MQGLLGNVKGTCVTEVIDQNIQKHEFDCLCCHMSWSNKI